MEVHGCSECEVAALRKRSDDQARETAQILIPILEGGTALLEEARLVLLVPVIPEMSVCMCV